MGLPQRTAPLMEGVSADENGRHPSNTYVNSAHSLTRSCTNLYVHSDQFIRRNNFNIIHAHPWRSFIRQFVHASTQRIVSNSSIHWNQFSGIHSFIHTRQISRLSQDNWKHFSENHVKYSALNFEFPKNLNEIHENVIILQMEGKLKQKTP